MKYHKLQFSRVKLGRTSSKRNSRFRAWHRRLGLVSCLFILLLSLTGILINHSHHLGLDKPGVELDWLLDLYGIGQPDKISHFALLPTPLLGVDNQLWLADKLILESSFPVLSALWYQNQIIAIDRKQLYIFDNLGQLLETQNSSNGFTPPLANLLLSGEDLILLLTQDGMLVSDQQLLDWRLADANTPQDPPYSPQTQTVELSPKQITMFRSRHLSWERVILDLHSGRIFGSWSVWLWDLFALALIVLTLSGIWMWQHKKLRH